jgi:cytochrome b561
MTTADLSPAAPNSHPARDRYTMVAIILHWLIALSIVGLIAVGFWMSSTAEALSEMTREERRALGPQLVQVFQMHKSMGLTVLVLSLARLAWRLAHRPPALPAAIPGWQKAAAGFTHVAFYVIMIAMPLSGWAYVSSGFNAEGEAFSATTMWFGLFEVPHIPLIAEAGEEMRKAIAASAYEMHELLAYAIIALLVLHIGAALKHQFVDRDGVAGRMIPFLKRT